MSWSLCLSTVAGRVRGLGWFRAPFLTLALLGSGTAHALTCGDIMKMHRSEVPQHVIISTMDEMATAQYEADLLGIELGELASDFYTAAGIDCLTREGAPEEIIAAARRQQETLSVGTGPVFDRMPTPRDRPTAPAASSASGQGLAPVQRTPFVDCAGPAKAQECVEIGWRHTTGEAQPKDDALASAYYAEACAYGNSGGCHNLGLAYLWGYGVPADPLRALELYERSCALGSRSICKSLRTDPILLALKRCRKGAGGGCNAANAHYTQETGYGGYVAGATRSWGAQVVLATHGCEELGHQTSCKRLASLRENYQETRFTPSILEIDGQRIGPVARGCVGNNNADLCMVAVSRLDHEKWSTSWSHLDRYVAASKLCELGNGKGCTVKRDIENGKVPMTMKQAMGGALSAAGQIAGAMSEELANAGHMNAAGAAYVAGVVAPEMGRGMQGGEDAVWVGGAVAIGNAVAAQVRSGLQDAHARATLQGPPIGPPVPSAASSVPSTSTAQPTVRPEDCMVFPKTDHCSEQLKLEGAACRSQHPDDGTPASKTRYASCFKQATERHGACVRQAEAEAQARLSPECRSPSGSGAASTLGQ